MRRLADDARDQLALGRRGVRLIRARLGRRRPREGVVVGLPRLARLGVPHTARESVGDLGMDFQFDATADGRTIKMLNVIDEFTREALAIEIDRSIDADGVVRSPERLTLTVAAR
jgi:hypothetical protein